MGWLDRITDDFGGLFWVIIMLGSWVATLAKKRRSGEDKVEVEVAVEELESLLEFPDLETLATVPAQPFPPIPQMLLPPPSPQPMTSRGKLGALSSSLESKQYYKPDTENVTFDIYQSDVGTSKLGELEVTGPAVIERKEGWKPRTSWGEAFVLREVLGPPRALCGFEPHGLQD